VEKNNMKKLLLLAVLATAAHAQSTTLCANKTNGNLFFRSRCYSSERAITNLSSLQGPKGETGATGAAGSFSSCYQITADVGANLSDVDYTLICGNSGDRDELVYHSELFSPHAVLSAPQQGFSPWVENGKTVGGGWNVPNADLSSVGPIPTGLCCPIG
jgi:hypothetical protein